ncbi:hypothetical protein Metev_0753 [Methanohalobium evestigatum Z-7303]|uniref:Uncharacterized protein n=1 Tax=Methanohalobium evestigatum (strain ATCC BAA-1072 / DSM 3721 / NBRC 107634 / OCM 161 / Z-7303) TaxID=644295 RepID=D7E730_METEZ|nr:hypothetical protein [Methanohalobium evestigatum]ADI73654.1 hypothetical protein Metev_0753 [Methanohalobium evestigatum Z-7303]
MTESNSIGKIKSELQEGIKFVKCYKCGCMENTLQNCSHLIATIDTDEPLELRNKRVYNHLENVQLL